MWADGIEGTDCRGWKWTRELYWLGKDGNGMGGNVVAGKDVTQMWVWIESGRMCGYARKGRKSAGWER